MCTAVVLGNEKLNCNTLSRTLDFEFIIDSEIAMLPRNYKWVSNDSQTEYVTKYAMCGMGGDHGGYIFNEAVNEKGLASAMLYLPGFAEYNDDEVEGKVNLAPYEVLKWIVSSFETIEEVKEAVINLNVLKRELKAFKMLLPVHWIVTDKSGKTLVIEPINKEIKIYEKNVGVMTNSPSYDWHMTNLRNYISTSPTPLASIEMDNQVLDPISEGTGLLGFPGDVTSTARFVRAAYGRKMILDKELIDSSQSAVSHAFKVLDNVAIPKGYMDTAQGHIDFSIYKICMSCTDSKYYYKTYVGDTLCCFDLLKQDLDAKDPIHFKLNNEVHVVQV